MKPIPIAWDETTDGCWICNSHRPNSSGYPGIKRDRVGNQVAAFVYEECFGPIPTGMVLRHKCNERKCINPEHLEIGTQSQNLFDKRKFRTDNRGERHPLHKLTTKDVEQIRSIQGLSQEVIAKMFSVSRSTISFIRSGKRWRLGAT